MDFLNKILPRTLTALSLLILLSACYSDFDPDIHEPPVLCMNSIIESGKPIEVKVTHTQRYNNTNFGHPNYGAIVKDAVVSLYINNEFIESTDSEGKEWYDIKYEFGYLPQPGDTIRLIADSKEYGIAEASVVVPNQVKIENVEHSIYGVELNYKSIVFNDSFKITFTDTHGETNYYRLIAKPVVPTPIQGDGDVYDTCFSYFNLDYGFEPVFSEHIKAFDLALGAVPGAFSLFSDKQLQGKPYTLKLKVENARIYSNNPDGNESLYDLRLCFSLYNVSESYYNWFIYDWQASESMVGNLAEIGVADLFIPYSNVSTNAGIVAAFTSSEAEISYADLIREYLPVTPQ